MKHCPCKSRLEYQKCCGRYIEGHEHAPTPLALMRSRYTAYTHANMQYIIETMKEPASKNFDPLHAAQWAQQVTWLSLKIIHAPPVKPKATVGYVEFIARYKIHNQVEQIRERSMFHYEKGRWYYVDHCR